MSDVTFLGDHDLGWAFRGEGLPSYNLNIKNWSKEEIVDPFPCYSHDAKLVLNEIESVESILPLKFPVKWFVLSHEFQCRTNGYACENKDYDEKDREKLFPFIVLCGKRIPIMPSMTRYLVSHEYGHVVDYHLQLLMKTKNSEFDNMYADLRKIRNIIGYGGRKWHSNISEIIANDIRIILFNKEVDFWPHDCSHPLENPALIEWWADKKEKLLKHE